jgi:hypothetical protein
MLQHNNETSHPIAVGFRCGYFLLLHDDLGASNRDLKGILVFFNGVATLDMQQRTIFEYLLCTSV